MSEITQPSVDWDAIWTNTRARIVGALSSHPAIGKALTFADGESLATALTSELTVAIHRAVDPEYEG